MKTKRQIELRLAWWKRERDRQQNLYRKAKSKNEKFMRELDFNDAVKGIKMLEWVLGDDE